MHKIRFETLLPDELQALLTGRSLVYQPVGSMEWHGPHMGMGLSLIHISEPTRRS